MICSLSATDAMMALFGSCRKRLGEAVFDDLPNRMDLLVRGERRPNAECAGRMQGSHTEVQRLPPLGPEAKEASDVR